MHSALHSLRWNYEVAATQVELALLSVCLIVLKAGFRSDQPRDDQGRWSGGGGRDVAVRVTRTYETGNARIDARTRILTDVAKDVLSVTGRGFGSLYGTFFHAIFARQVKELDLPGIGSRGVEVSFSAGDLVRYGLKGSVRTDVIFRDGSADDAPILAVWDVKTGNERMDERRVADIRAGLGIGADVPVIEIHIDFGVSIKSTEIN